MCESGLTIAALKKWRQGHKPGHKVASRACEWPSFESGNIIRTMDQNSANNLNE